MRELASMTSTRRYTRFVCLPCLTIRGYHADKGKKRDKRKREKGKKKHPANLACQVPIGPWAKGPMLKELGRLTLMHSLEGLESFTLGLFSRVLGWTRQEIDDLMYDVKKELLNPNNHFYVSAHFLYGQKPPV